MLDRKKFSRLSIAERLDLITDKGKCIASMEIPDYIVNLHLVEDTFLEFWFYLPDYTIDRIEILEDGERLNLFIDHMDD